MSTSRTVRFIISGLGASTGERMRAANERACACAQQINPFSCCLDSPSPTHLRWQAIQGFTGWILHPVDSHFGGHTSAHPSYLPLLIRARAWISQVQNIASANKNWSERDGWTEWDVSRMRERISLRWRIVRFFAHGTCHPKAVLGLASLNCRNHVIKLCNRVERVILVDGISPGDGLDGRKYNCCTASCHFFERASFRHTNRPLLDLEPKLTCGCEHHSLGAGWQNRGRCRSHHSAVLRHADKIGSRKLFNVCLQAWRKKDDERLLARAGAFGEPMSSPV